MIFKLCVEVYNFMGFMNKGCVEVYNFMGFMNMGFMNKGSL